MTRLRLSVLIALAAACHPTPKPKNPDRDLGKGAPRVDPSTLPKRNLADGKLPPNPPSFLFATVPDKSVGPFLAKRAGTAMGAYIGSGEDGTHRIVSLPLGADGSPLEPRVVSTVSHDATALVVRPAGGERGAYIVAWTQLTDKGESLSVVGVTVEGKSRSGPVEIARTQDDIVWVELVPTARGEVCVWAEETGASGANLFAIALEPDGSARGLPSEIVRGVVGWQAVGTMNGAGLAFVTRKDTSRDGTIKAASTVSWLKLDAEARPVAPPLAIGTSPQRVLDIDVVRSGDGFVFAWTRRGAPESAVMVASLEGDGKLVPPHSITERSGGASLIDAASNAQGGVIAWQETTHLARGSRRLHLVPLSRESPRGGATGVVLDVDTAGMPEVVPLEHGYAVLSRLRTCPTAPTTPEDCDDPPAAPAFVRLDERFAVVETQPILIDETPEHATLAWGLSCDKDDCLLLAAGTENPARVRDIRLSPNPNHWRPPLPAAPPADAPRVVAVDTLASDDLYSEVAVTSARGGSLVAEITSESAPGTSANEPRRGATLSIAPLDASGVLASASPVLSRRALPEGGVSIAAADGIPGAALAWVARENGNAAVHVSRLDDKGRRTNDIQLTTTAGDASDVAIAWVPGGWVVAWVDTRDGNGEVYATKVDPDLRRIAREERITHAAGDASDVAILAQPGSDGGTVWLAWADPRESPHDGIADIYVARLHGNDAKVVGAESRVLATVPHSRSPALAPGLHGSGAVLAWIEEAPVGADPKGASVYGAMIGALDDQGKLAPDPLRTRGAGEGFPTSIALDRAGEALHVVLARGSRDDIFLDGMTLTPGAPPRPFLLFGLEGPPSMDVSLAVLGDGVYFNDQGDGPGEGRVRRATIEWKH